MNNTKNELLIKVLRPGTAYAVIPTYASAGSAGLDLRTDRDIIFNRHEEVIIHTGIAVAIPEGYCGMIVPRSGLVLNTVLI